MAEQKLYRVKNVSGGPRTLAGRNYEDAAVVEVPEDGVYGLTCQESNWAPADAAAKKVHDREHTAQVERNKPSQPEAPAVETTEAVEADEKEND